MSSSLYLDCVKSIYDRISDNWSTLPILLDNDKGETLDLTSGFVYFRVIFTNSNPATINNSNPKVRTIGQANLHVFTPLNTGVGLGLTYAGELAQYIRNVTIGDVLFFSPVILSGQQNTMSKGEFWETPLTCPFQYDKHVVTEP